MATTTLQQRLAQLTQQRDQMFAMWQQTLGGIAVIEGLIAEEAVAAKAAEEAKPEETDECAT